MKKFNLEEAKAGKAICTREGDNAKQDNCDTIDYYGEGFDYDWEEDERQEEIIDCGNEI